jgi:hypothetical protein
MRKLFTFLIALGAIVFVNLSAPAVHAGCVIGGGFICPSPSSGVCTQATNFLARVAALPATLDTTHTNAYTNMICGLVTDGVITGTMNGANSGSGACGSYIDALYVFATNTTSGTNTSAALLNLCGTSYTASPQNSPTFAADQGYTGLAASSQYVNLGFNPSTATTPNYVRNCSMIAAYDRTNRSTTQTYTSIGAGQGGVYSYIQPYRVSGGNHVNVELNAATFPYVGSTISTSQGFQAAIRASSSTIDFYLNSNSTPVTTGASSNSTGLPNTQFNILQIGGSGSYSSDQIAAAVIGGFSGTCPSTATWGPIWQSISSRINAYMTALGTNVY